MEGKNTNKKNSTKVRLVKCPKCAKLLPEPEHVPLYTCGGCGTTLQAKYYRGKHKDITLSSHGRDDNRSNGFIHARNGGESDGSSRKSSSSVEHSKAQDKGREQDAVESSSDCEQNGPAISSNHASVSKESSILKNKENGAVDKKVNQLDLKDQNEGRDQEAVKSCSDSEKNGTSSNAHGHHTPLPEESSLIENKDNGDICNKIDQLDLKNHVSNGFSNVLEKKEQEQRNMEKTATEDDNDQDEQCNGIAANNHQHKQTEKVNSGRENQPLEETQVHENGEQQKIALVRRSTEDGNDYQEQKQVAHMTSSSAISNDAKCDASAHVGSKESTKMHLVGEHSHQDQHEKTQNGYVDSSIDNSSSTTSSAIEDSAECEASNHEVSEETRKMQLAGKQSYHEQKQAGQVKSSIKDSFLTESSAIKNLAKHDACDKEVSEETSEKHLAGKHSHQNQCEREQIGYVNSPKNASSLTVSSAIKNPVEHGVSHREVSEETRKMDNVENRFGMHQPEQKQAENVNSTKDVSSLHESSVIKNRAEHDSFHHEVSEVTRMTPLVGKDSHYVQHEQSQDSAKDASSTTRISVIEEPTQMASGNSANHDASDQEVGKETEEMQYVGKDSHHDRSESDIKCHDNVEVGVENSGKGFESKRDPTNFIECMGEEHGILKLSNEASLFTDAPQGGNYSFSAPSNATNTKTSREMGAAKVSREPHFESISVENGKGTSKQNVKTSGDDSVYTDTKGGILLHEVPRYLKQRSPAYDGSVSSFDGNDDQMEERPSKIVQETLSPYNAVAGYDEAYDGAEESPEWNHTLSDGMIYRKSKAVRSSSSMQLDKKLKNSMAEEREPLEEYRNRYGPNRGSFLPRVPNHRRSSDVAFETGSSSSYALHDGSPSHQIHNLPYRRRIPDVAFWREKEFLPTHYNKYETSGEIYDRPHFHQVYSDRRRRAENRSQSGTLPRMPYSGEIFNGRDPYIHHRYPDDRRWSAQLPPPSVCFHQGVYMGPPWDTRRDPYDPYPASPQRFVESESSCAWGHDTASLSDDQRHRDQIMRRMYLREKRQAVKKQFHPTAGGAPFISCSSCFNILQVPKGFLVSSRRTRRRSQKLQCGACSNVLEFSVENESGLARFETNVDRTANQAVSSSSHVNHSRHNSLTSVDGRELLSRDSFGASGRESTKLAHGSSRTRMRMERLHDDDEHPDRGRQGKVTWKLPTRSKSPLHRLMGYSSPQDLLSAFEADDVK